jgi:hypothetical protein
MYPRLCSAVENKKMCEDGTIRYQCLILDSNPAARNLIRRVNIQDVPDLSPKQQSEVSAMCAKMQKTIESAMQSQSLQERRKLFTECNDQAQSVLALCPHNGHAYSVLGDIAHNSQKPPTTIARIMRRAVANGGNTGFEHHRRYLGRFGYAGGLGQ